MRSAREIPSWSRLRPNVKAFPEDRPVGAGFPARAFPAVRLRDGFHGPW